MSEYKNGQKVKIVDNYTLHGFKLGEVVTLKEQTDFTEWLAEDDHDFWWSQEPDFEAVE